jgi:hypothetical protein
MHQKHAAGGEFRIAVVVAVAARGFSWSAIAGQRSDLVVHGLAIAVLALVGVDLAQIRF